MKLKDGHDARQCHRDRRAIDVDPHAALAEIDGQIWRAARQGAEPLREPARASPPTGSTTRPSRRPTSAAADAPRRAT
jgi:hypothetical protein